MTIDIEQQRTRIAESVKTLNGVTSGHVHLVDLEVFVQRLADLSAALDEIERLREKVAGFNTMKAQLAAMREALEAQLLLPDARTCEQLDAVDEQAQKALSGDGGKELLEWAIRVAKWYGRQNSLVQTSGYPEPPEWLKGGGNGTD